MAISWIILIKSTAMEDVKIIVAIRMISLVTYSVGSAPPLADANESPSPPTGEDNHHLPLDP